MRRIGWVTALLTLLAVGSAWGQTRVESVRMWPAPDNTRVVLDVSGAVKHSLFTLSKPDRVVVDIENAQLSADLPKVEPDDSLIYRVRSGTRNNGRDLRVVLDLKRGAKPKSFFLEPNEKYGHRLVIDLHEIDSTRKEATGPVKTLPGTDGKLRELVIAIDAGHGGEDPGASGPGGVREKDVVLGIARRLETLVAKEPGMRPLMIRDGDYFVSLRKRVDKARRHGADLFISLHADAFRDQRVTGSSVYTLSRRGASSEHARLLAQSENASDLVGGVSLDDKDDLLASVLLDLSQTATIEASNDLALQVVRHLGRVGKMHKRSVEHAGFRVLKAPDIPSMLIETGFISSPADVRRLTNANEQYRIAAAIMSGVRTHFRQHPPPGTLLARVRSHTIESGDTLSDLAARYRTSVDHLRNYNNLSSSTVHVGQVLRIPPSDS